MHLFHKWIYLQKNTSEFLGVEYEANVDAGIRICKTCKKAQKNTHRLFFSWVDLNKYEKSILVQKLASQDVFKRV